MTFSICRHTCSLSLVDGADHAETHEPAQHAEEHNADHTSAEVASQDVEHPTDDTGKRADTGDGSGPESLASLSMIEEVVQQQAEAAADLAAADTSSEDVHDDHRVAPGILTASSQEPPPTTSQTYGLEAPLEDTGGDYGDSEEIYDADEAHEHPGHEEGGDYVEDAEFPDDEDEFSGEARDDAYPHIEATEDAVNQAPYAEDANEDPQENVTEERSGDELDQGMSIIRVSTVYKLSSSSPGYEDRSLSQHAGTDIAEHSNSIKGTRFTHALGNKTLTVVIGSVPEGVADNSKTSHTAPHQDSSTSQCVIILFSWLC